MNAFSLILLVVRHTVTDGPSFCRQRSKPASCDPPSDLPWASPAAIRPDGGFAKWHCTVLDVSDTGVRLKLDADHIVPTTFNFVSAKTGGLSSPHHVSALLPTSVLKSQPS